MLASIVVGAIIGLFHAELLWFSKYFAKRRNFHISPITVRNAVALSSLAPVAATKEGIDRDTIALSVMLSQSVALITTWVAISHSLAPGGKKHLPAAGLGAARILLPVLLAVRNALQEDEKKGGSS